jgi:predicted amidophosphoribosyltransferase
MRAGAPITFLRDLVAPPRCATCAGPCASVEAICRACRRRLERARTGSAVLAGIGPVSWSAPYEDVARELVAALKFRGALGLARVAAAAIAADVAARASVEFPAKAVASSTAAGPEAWTVVPVPAAPLRRRRRGYDPAELIAADVSSLLGVPAAASLGGAGAGAAGRRCADDRGDAGGVCERAARRRL